MNIETRDGDIHYVTAEGRRSYLALCGGAPFVKVRVAVTDRPVNCAVCLRRLEKQQETPCSCYPGCDRTITTPKTDQEVPR